MPQVSAAVLRSTPSSTSASASIRRAAALSFSPLAALRSSEAVRSSRVIDTAAPIDAAPLKSQHRVRVSLIWESLMSHSFGPLVSQVNIPHPGFDRQAVQFHLCQRGCGKSRDDIVPSHGALKPIELISADDDNGIFAVQRDSLRTALLRFPDHLAKAGLRVLKPPSPGPGAGHRRAFFAIAMECHFLVTVTRILKGAGGIGKRRPGSKKYAGTVPGQAEDRRPR